MQHTTAHDYQENPFDLAILPLGSLESHGSHLPFATDAYTAAILAEEVAKQIPGAAVLPVVPYGVSEHYRDFPFTVSLRFGTEIAIIGGDIPESLHREGIRHVFILNGHDGNIAPIENASRKVKAPHPEMKIATFGAWWESIAPPLLPEGFFEVWEGLGHGGEGETSISLALFEELCQMEHAAGRMPDLPEFGEIKWLFSEITDCGATGDPTKGSSEKGLVMKKALVDAIVLMLKELNTTGWRYGYKP